MSAVKTATFTILKINDTTAPTATAATSGNKDQREHFVGSATLTLTATDDATGSGVQTIEYRTNGGAWTTYTAPVAFNAAGNYTVDYRATDKVNNTSAPKQVTFRVLSGAGCTQTRSDEFDGTTLGPAGSVTRATAARPTSAITFADGQLRMPTADFELDAANAQTSVGPVNFIGQDLNALGDNWQVETEFTVKYTGGWQNTGLIIWNGDDNFVRSVDHAQPDRRQHLRRAVQGQPVRHDAEGARAQAGSNITIAPNKTDPITIRCATRAPTGPTRSSRSTGSWRRPPSRWPDCANFGGAGELHRPQPGRRPAP